MFCSRVCSNVELEVGNMIRLFPPWYDPQSGLFLKCKLLTIFAQEMNFILFALARFLLKHILELSTLECRSCLSFGNLTTSQKTLERIFCHVEVNLC